MKRLSWATAFHVATFAGAVCGVVAAVAAYRGIAIGAGLLTAAFSVLSAYGSYFDSAAGLRQLHQAFAWRSLTSAHRTKLVQQLRGTGLVIELDCAAGPEARSYAAELKTALEEAGCVVTTSNALIPDSAYWGLLGPGPDFILDDARILHDAFRAAGIPLRPVLDVTACLRIIVATKPPAKKPAPPEQPISGVRANPPFEE